MNSYIKDDFTIIPTRNNMEVIRSIQNLNTMNLWLLLLIVAKTEHSHPLGMVVSTHFRCGKWVKRGLKNGALPFTSYEGV